MTQTERKRVIRICRCALAIYFIYYVWIIIFQYNLGLFPEETRQAAVFIRIVSRGSTLLSLLRTGANFALGILLFRYLPLILERLSPGEKEP